MPYTPPTAATHVGAVLDRARACHRQRERARHHPLPAAGLDIGATERWSLTVALGGRSACPIAVRRIYGVMPLPNVRWTRPRGHYSWTPIRDTRRELLT